MAKRNTTNTFAVVALLFFLTAFFVYSAELSGQSVYRGKVPCAPGDVNMDGTVATETDFSKLDGIRKGDLDYITCADLNRDGSVDFDDHQILTSIAKELYPERRARGYLADPTVVAGYYTYTGARTCAVGDVNRDGRIATENDFEKLEKVMRGSVGFVDCADLNKDGVVNEVDMNMLFDVAAGVARERYSRGRYCFDQCVAGDKICAAEHRVSLDGGTLAESEGNIYKVCGNYDDDPCTEWSTQTFACSSAMRCRIKNPGSDFCEYLNLPEENILQQRYPLY